MQKHLAWLPVAGLFGVLATAHAQTPASAGGRSYDGNYRLVSSANVNTTYTTRKGQTAPCPSRRAGPLHITNHRYGPEGQREGRAARRAGDASGGAQQVGYPTN